MARKETAIGLFVFCASSVLAVGCGDGEPQTTTSALTASAGGSVEQTGGSASTGGSSAHTGGNSSTSATTGGSAASGGSNNSGGSGGIAGTSTSSVGGGTAGAAGNAGSTSTGGSANGGSPATGGSNQTGGNTATGGLNQTGGNAATGGSAALSCTASFAIPTNNQTLTSADDLNGNCSDGIQTNVVVATSAPDGTAAALSVTNSSGTASVVATTTVAGLVARFNSATLPSSGQAGTGQATLSVAIGGTACTASEAIVLNCSNAPACSITSPTISAAHPALNGVPVAQGGDQVSSSPKYQVAFQIATNIEDGQPVVLTIDGTTTYPATASGGKASFAGVTLTPDGTHTASATCTAKSGLAGSSGTLYYPVDTTPPQLTPEKGTGTGGTIISPLVSGDHFASTDDADPNTPGLQIEFCGTTTSSDALDISSADPNAVNFCASIGGNTPVCAAATAAAGNGACVNINCPGNGAFSVALTLKDAAGNPTTSTTTNVTCASISPSVTFVDPISDGPLFSNVSKEILAADNTGATRVDQNAAVPGAQYNVIACTSAPTGSTAILSLGYMGQSLTQSATNTVVTDSSNQCSGGNLVLFNAVTLPESKMDSGGNLVTATELQVSVTDLNLATGSATADVWVDSTDPTLTLALPANFCGSYINTSSLGSTAPVTLTFASSVSVVVSVQETSGTAHPSPNPVTTAGQVTFDVQLEPGSDTVSAIATKPSSNFTDFGNCTVSVGYTQPPTVTWQTPLNTSWLTAAGNTNSKAIPDNNSATAGWQGTLTACTNIDTTTYPGATIQFSANGTNIGSPVAIDAASMCATLANATVPEGPAVLLTATTSPIAGNPGSASITVVVDSTIPTAPSGLGAIVKNRRQTSFTLSWLAPSDGTNGNVTGYQIRIAKSVISTQQAFNAATVVPYTGAPAAPNTADSIDILNQYIENDYYFAIAATDSVGNIGPFVYTTAATRASFIQLDLKPAYANERFGDSVDATGDLNGDGFSDLVISYGAGTEVDIFFGSANGVSATPSVRIQGTANPFAYSLSAIGDVNSDGYEDMAIGSATDGNGKVYVYYGRSTANWNLKTTLAPADANVTITANSTTDPNFAGGGLGASIARLGDYNNDGVDDFAVGAPVYNSKTGLVAIIPGIAMSAGGLPSAISLPSAFGSNAIRIDGGPSGTYFGLRVLGLGRFYGGTTTPMLIVAAPYANTNEGQLYSFMGTTGVLNASNAVNTLVGSANDFVGFQNLNALGNVGPGGQPSFGVSLSNATPVRVDAWSGTSSAGPFNVRASYTSSETATNAFGRTIVGGGSSGRSTTFSFIGSSRSDIAIATSANTNPRAYIIDGDKVAMTSTLNPVTVESIADVTIPLSVAFVSFSRNITGAPDIDGDGYGDLVFAELDYTTTVYSGHVLVLR